MRIAAVLLFLGCSGANMMSVGPAPSIWFMGDSQTATVRWQLATGGLVDQLNAKLGTTRTDVGQQVTPSNSPALTASSARALFIGRGVTQIPFAANGWRASDIDNEMTTNLAAISAGTLAVPTNIVNYWAINDADFPTPLGAFDASCASIFTKQLSIVAASQILVVGILTNGELWGPGPVWANGAIDGTIDTYDAHLAAAAATAGVTYVQVRPQALSQIEAAFNLPYPGSACGVMMDCGTTPHIHVLTTGPHNGAVFLANEAMAKITVTP